MSAKMSFKEQKGLTLIEVMIALAILGIIVVAFMPLFGVTFANIYSYGSRDEAKAKAAEQLEELYAEQPFPFEGDPDIVGTLKEGVDEYQGEHIEGSENDLHTPPKEADFNFSVEENFEPMENEEDVKGYKVTIVFFYQDGERHVELTSFIRGTEGE